MRLVAWPKLKYFKIIVSFLHHDHSRFRDAYLLITVKDSGFMGNGIFLGEALLPIQEIQMSDTDAHLSDLPQIQLPLTKPCSDGNGSNSPNLNGVPLLTLTKYSRDQFLQVSLTKSCETCMQSCASFATFSQWLHLNN